MSRTRPGDEVGCSSLFPHMSHSRSDFLDILGPRRAQRLERHLHSACGLWPNFEIAYVNPAWIDFAERNGGADVRRRWSEGADFLAAVAEPLRPHYDQHLRACLAGGSSWTSEYECSSPNLFRAFRMEVEVLRDAAGLVIVHTCIDQHPHDESHRAARPSAALYLDDHGLLLQCVHCRRVRRVGADEDWDWVPEWVAHVPDNASGGLCPGCLMQRYPDLARHSA